MRFFFGGNKLTLDGYSDYDMAEDIDFGNPISSKKIKFVGGVVAWQSSLQKCVALSIQRQSLLSLLKHAKSWYGWFFLQEHRFVQEKYVLSVNSQNVIHLGKNPTFYNRSKHIDVRYHWIHDVLDHKLLELAKFYTNDNGFDMVTKALSRERSLKFVVISSVW